MIYLKLTLMAVFWGGTFVAGRIVVLYMGVHTAAFLRFSVAALCLGLIVIRADGALERPTAANLMACALLALTGVVSYNILFFKGLSLIEAGRAAIIIANNPIGIALFSALLFNERLSWVQTFGVILSVTGAIIVISRGELDGFFSQGIGLGEIYILGCVASWVAYSLLGKQFLKHMTPLTAVFFTTVIGSVLLLPFAIFEGMLSGLTEIPVTAWVCILFLALLGTVLGFIWYYEGIRDIGAAKAGTFINIVPLSAIGFGFIILDESLTSSLILGTSLVLLGIWLVNRKP